MNLKKFFDIHHYLIARVALWTVVTAIVVYQVTFGIALYFAERDMMQQANEKVDLGLDIALNSVNDELKGVEDASANVVEYLESHTPTDKEMVKNYLESFILPNTFIQGVVLAFEPTSAIGQGKGYAPYIMRNGGEYIVRDLKDSQPDYTHRSWYADAVKAKDGVWNEMLQEINGTEIISFSRPFYNTDGTLLGVFVIDIAVTGVEDQLGDIQPFPNSAYFVLDHDKHIIISSYDRQHTGKKLVDVTTNEGWPLGDQVLADIDQRVRRSARYEKDGKEMCLYYAPTKYGNLTIAVGLPLADVVAPVASQRRMMMTLSLLGILALVVAIVLVLRRQMKSVHLFTNAARSIAQGNFNTPIPEAGDPNELYRLGVALNEMQTSLRTYMTELATSQQERGRIENELHIASDIQKSMLPKTFPPFPERVDLDIYGLLIPAKEVGGDLYDFFIRDEKLYFCIGDVSGKGVPASLMMAVTRSLIRIASLRESSPSRIMGVINDSMADMNESSMFVTMFVGVLDLPTGRLRYCNGGHNAPLLISHDGTQVEMIKVNANLPVGVLEKMEFEGQEMILTPGDSIFLYTDGLTEAENADHHQFGEEAMMQAAKGEHGNTHNLLDNMVARVRQHAGNAEQSDDLTMLAIRYLGQDSKVTFTKSLTLTNDINEISRLEEYIETVGSELGWDMSTVMNINLALEEAVANVINYAYPLGTTGTLDITTSATCDEVRFVITDHGQPFDPTAQKDPDITLGVEERQIGGLGIHLMRNIMDSVNYERLAGSNVLTLRKSRKAPKQ